MLRTTMPHVDAWNTWHAWYGNSVDGLQSVMDKVDEACADLGRDPDEIVRTTTALIQFPVGIGRESHVTDSRPVEPLRGSPEELAEYLRAYADHGIGHIQLVLDPISSESIEPMAPVLELLAKLTSKAEALCVGSRLTDDD
jgi:alkanesulfonate monooxygenase SsuD/methylene tetrahydromethanopterin reductase-like flavin-dependent oxidoreductase (luciferase family)